MKFLEQKCCSSNYVTNASSVVLAAAVLLVAGCTARAVPLSDPNPSDAAASVGASTAYQPSLAEDDEDPATHPTTEPTAAPHSHEDTPQVDLTYACPMHPEITGGQGERCPKCGMELVLVEPSP